MQPTDKLIYDLLVTSLGNLGNIFFLWIVLYIVSLVVDFVMTWRFHRAVLAEIKQDKSTISYLNF